jgi:hypothetical protein
MTFTQLQLTIIICGFVRTVNSTSNFALWTLYRSYVRGISANIELQVYSVTCCWRYSACSRGSLQTNITMIFIIFSTLTYSITNFLIRLLSKILITQFGRNWQVHHLIDYNKIAFIGLILTSSSVVKVYVQSLFS